MHIERSRAHRASCFALALLASCAGQPPPDEVATSQDLVGPPGPASEVVFPHEYTDVLIGRGIRTVTSSRLPASCVELPEGVKYQVTNTAWRSEGSAVANQAEFAQKFGLDANLAVAHGPVSANLGLQAMRESEWSSASMKLVIKAVYTYDVIMIEPDKVTLSQAAYDLIKPPAGADPQTARDARARDFLRACGRYWTKGVKKGAELAIVYSFRNTTRAQRESLTTTAGATVPATTTVGGNVAATQQQSFRQAIQGATLRVYGRGFKINAGDPLTPIAQAMDPAANNQLTTLTGFFNDIKTSVNEDAESDALEGATPLTSNTNAWKLALIGQYYHPLFRNPRTVGSPLAPWAANAQTDLLGQDNALYTTITQYTDFLRSARAAETTAGLARRSAADGRYNFETNPEHDIPALLARIDTLRDKVRVVEDPTGPLAKGVNGGLNTDAQDTGYWARRCWNMVASGNEPDTCYAVAPFLAAAQAELARFRTGMVKPLNFFSSWWKYDTLFGRWSGPNKADGKWSWADEVCKEHWNWAHNARLGLKLPSREEVPAFGAFLSGTPEHLQGWPGFAFSKKFLWLDPEKVSWEWVAAPANWQEWGGGNPDNPWACIRPGGPFAMPLIMF